MAKNKEDLKNLGPEHLKEKLNEAYKELIKLRAEVALRKLKNVHALKAKRKEVAQIKTFLKES